MERMLRDPRVIWLTVGPALLIYSLLMLVPIIWSTGYTLFSGSPVGGMTFNGIGNYLRLVQDPNFWSALQVTILYAVIVTAGQIIFGYLLALAYQFYLKRSSSLVRTLVFFPIVLPTVAIAQMFVKLFALTPQNGLVNSILSGIGLGGSTDWLGTGAGAFFVLVVMDIWRSMGFYAILLYAGLVDIPDELIESARIDGASGLRLVRRIILPLMAPILISAIIFSLNGSLKVFDSVMALTAGGPGNATTPLTVMMYNTAFSFGDYGYGSTIAMALTVLCLGATLILFRASRQDVTE